jgi:hypothetical protein
VELAKAARAARAATLSGDRRVRPGRYSRYP